MLITPYVLIAQLLVFTSPGRLHEKAYFPESLQGGSVSSSPLYHKASWSALRTGHQRLGSVYLL